MISSVVNVVFGDAFAKKGTEMSSQFKLLLLVVKKHQRMILFEPLYSKKWNLFIIPVSGQAP